MSTAAVCIDMGSTFTKVLHVDESGSVSLTRTRTRIADPAWPEEVEALTGDVPPDNLYCSSSAAGGLRLVAVGLTPELTTEAARAAALTAGARLVGVFAGGIARSDVARIESASPDLVLLAGGVDGGDREAVGRTAAVLVDSGLRIPVVVACNRVAAADVGDALAAADIPVRVTANVMPEFGRLDLEPARAAIAGFYLERIVAAKGVDPVARRSAHAVVPTPSAVLAATELLARQPGFESVMVVDAGGATVDVHSYADQEPRPSEYRVGLPVPNLTRTVEGDLGLKWNAAAVVEASPGEAGGDDLVEARRIETDDDALPSGALAERLLERAVGVAVRRHCGRPIPRLTAIGFGWAFEGKDCRRVGTVVGTGGPFRVSSDPARALRAWLTEGGDELVPESPSLSVDRGYGMIAAGLLAPHRPDLAAHVLNTSLDPMSLAAA